MAREVYSASLKRNVTGWAHYQADHNGVHKVGPWYQSKVEILADHESYLIRAGWMGAES
jgi:hypothetical protein